MALINNPLGDLLGPVHRLEVAVAELSENISAVEALPRIEAELCETRAATLAMLDELRGARDDIARLTALLADALGGTNPRRRGPVRRASQ